MAQFDVYANPSASKTRVPYLLDVQAELLHTLATRVVIPLIKPSALGNKIIRDLHFEVEIAGHRLIAVTSEMAAIPAKLLGKKVGSLTKRRTDIIRGLDIVIAGV